MCVDMLTGSIDQPNQALVVALPEKFMETSLVQPVAFPDLPSDPVSVDCPFERSFSDDNKDLCRNFLFSGQRKPVNLQRM